MAEITKKDFLLAFPFFRRSPEGLFSSMLSQSSRMVFPGGRQIFRRGDACGGIAFLFSGEIRVYKAGEGTREITLYDVLPGETCILNAACILSGAPYPAHAVTTHEGEAMFVTAADFRRLVDEYADMRRFIFDKLGERLIAVTDLVEEVVFRRMDERLRDFLVEKSENGVLAATHQKIANDLGTSREVVTRLLQDLEKKGDIMLSRSHIRIIRF